MIKASRTNWSVLVYTSNLKNAGTDANVHIQIFGDKAQTSALPLEKKGETNLFETGKCDKFDMNLPDIGKPTKIKIGHDNVGLYPEWHLDKVKNKNRKNIIHSNLSISNENQLDRLIICSFVYKSINKRLFFKIT
jgi:hypothetical protein